MQHLFCDAGQRRARMWKNTLIRSTFACISCTSLWRTFRLVLWVNNHFPSAIQCTTAFVTQGSAEQTCETLLHSTFVHLARVFGKPLDCFVGLKTVFWLTFNATPFLWRRPAQSKKCETLLRSTFVHLARIFGQPLDCFVVLRKGIMINFQSNTPFVTQGSTEQKCEKHWSVQPLLVYLPRVYGKPLDCFSELTIILEWPFDAPPLLWRRAEQGKHVKHTDPLSTSACISCTSK